MLRAAQRLMEAQEEDAFAPVLDEIAGGSSKIALQDNKEDQSSGELVAEALGIGMIFRFGRYLVFR